MTTYSTEVIVVCVSATIFTYIGNPVAFGIFVASTPSGSSASNSIQSKTASRVWLSGHSSASHLSYSAQATGYVSGPGAPGTQPA